jgi:4-aminobutyrate aminotransferase-like enzyme
VIVEAELDQSAAQVGRELLDALLPLAREHDFVTAVRGVGLFIGVDLAVDDAGCKEIFRECLGGGLLCMAYTRRVRLNPPLCLSREQAREGAALFADALSAWARKRR